MNECWATVSIKPTAVGHDKKSVSRGHARYPTEVMFTRSKKGKEAMSIPQHLTRAAFMPLIQYRSGC
jgi:hypothetical protein